MPRERGQRDLGLGISDRSTGHWASLASYSLLYSLCAWSSLLTVILPAQWAQSGQPKTSQPRNEKRFYTDTATQSAGGARPTHPVIRADPGRNRPGEGGREPISTSLYAKTAKIRPAGNRRGLARESGDHRFPELAWGCKDACMASRLPARELYSYSILGRYGVAGRWCMSTIEVGRVPVKAGEPCLRIVLQCSSRSWPPMTAGVAILRLSRSAFRCCSGQFLPESMPKSRVQPQQSIGVLQNRFIPVVSGINPDSRQ